MLINAAVTWREDNDAWDVDDVRWLHRERAVLGPAEFSVITNESVPAHLREEITAAIEAAEDPREPDRQ